MNYRQLGRTKLKVSEVVFGCFKTLDVSKPSELEQRQQLINLAIKLGVNFFDTAHVYGHSEQVLGKLVHQHREKVFLATKVYALSLKEAEQQISLSFKNLQTDTIELYQIHNMALWTQVLPLLKELKREEKIRFIGVTDYRVSNFPEVIGALKTEEFDTVQIPYNLQERTAEEKIFPLCEKLNIGTIIMTPISPLFDRNRLLSELEPKDLSFLRPYNITTPAQALLKFILENIHVDVVIPATSKLTHLRENVSVSDIPSLSKSDLNYLYDL